MSVRIGSRIEVRLDDEHRAKLARIVEARGGTVSDVLREMVDEEAGRLSDMEFERLLKYFDDDPIDLPPWEELKREIEHGHCPGEGPWCDEPGYHEPHVH